MCTPTSDCSLLAIEIGPTHFVIVIFLKGVFKRVL